MSEQSKKRLQVLDKTILVMIIANIFIVALTVLSYVRDGEFSNLSFVVGLTSLVALLVARAILHRKQQF